MEQNNQKRPTDRGKTTVTRERPRTGGASRPKAPRTRSGTASDREAQRRARLEQAGEGTRRRPPSSDSGRPAERSARRAGEPDRAGKTARDQQTAREVPSRKQAPEARKRTAQKPARPRSADPAGEAEAVRRKKKRAKKPHRVYNTNFGIKFAVMLAVVAVIVLSMVIFFKIKHINVILPGEDEGRSSYYTREEIIAASGINLDDNLLNLSKATVASRIQIALPYVDEIQIKKQLPGTVVISFTEFEVTYAIQDETGGWWLMSREGRILEAVEEQVARSHLRITGMPIVVPAEGDYIKPAATQGADMSEIESKRKVVLEVIPALENTDFIKQIDRVDVSTSYDLTLWWTGDRYEIRLGTIEKLAYKLQFLQATMENNDIKSRSGTIDLTFNEDDKVHFLPFP